MFSAKWLPALVPLYFLSLYWAGTSITTPLVSLLNAAGKVRATLVLNIIWTIAQVGLSLVFLQWYGYVGIAVAFAIVRGLAVIAVIAMVLPVVPIRLGQAVAAPLAVAIAVSVAGYAATIVLPANLLDLVLVAVAMAAVYAAVLFAVDRRRLRVEIGNLMVQIQPAANK